MNGLIQELHIVISPQAKSSTSLVQPSPDSLCSTCPPLQCKMRHAELAQRPLLLEDGNTMYTQIIHIQTVALTSTVKNEKACVYVFVYMHGCLILCISSQTSAEQTRPLINSDEWLEIVSLNPLSLSESFYLSLQGILPCDVASLLLS